MTQFSDLDLHGDILKAVDEKGYKTPSPIQAKAIPIVIKGEDLLAAAQTGTGKTAGFVLPMLHRIVQQKQGAQQSGHRSIKALILTPTRELAAQIQDNIEAYSKYLDVRSMVVFGGVGINPQINKLKRGVDILVATPGRLLDLCDQRACRIDKIDMLVLDEADRMLDMGFIHDIRKVLKIIPRKRQTLLFSATFSKEIKDISRQFLYRPQTVEVAAQNTTAERVKQVAYRCDASSKADLAYHLISKGDWSQVLIFTRTKHGANRLSDKLSKAGITSSAIHGNKSQGARERALKGFKDKTIRVLVATDIAARGLDIAQLPHVINYELPNVPADYVHRIGRTGRAGESGDAISLVGNDERSFLKEIEKLISQKIPLLTEEGFEPQLWPSKAPSMSEVMKADAERKKQNRQNRGPRNGRTSKPKSSVSSKSSSSNRRSESASEGGHNRPSNRSSQRRRGGPRRRS